MGLPEPVIQYLKKTLFQYPNVNGFSGDLLPRIKGGVLVPDELCIRVYVTEKKSTSVLKETDIIPRVINGIPTDVVAIGVVNALSDPRGRYRPAPAGVSAMNYLGTACSLGWVARDREGKLGILANNHCCCRENLANIGEPYIQPSPSDGGKIPDDTIAHLTSYVPIHFEEYTCPFRNLLKKILFWRAEKVNTVDVGFCRVVDENIVKKEVLNIGKVYGKCDPVLYATVQKQGRTTGHTKGRVVDTFWNGYVQYSRGKAFFQDCVLIGGKEFAAGGDSSSAILSDSDKPAFLGLLFAGSLAHSISCKTSNIERELGVTIEV